MAANLLLVNIVALSVLEYKRYWNVSRMRRFGNELETVGLLFQVRASSPRLQSNLSEIVRHELSTQVTGARAHDDHLFSADDR